MTAGTFYFPYTGTPEVNTMTDSGEFNNKNLTFEMKNYEHHYTEGRIIDLTPKVFSELDDLSMGIIEVRVEVI